MLKMTEEDFEKVIKINLTGAFNMTQAVWTDDQGTEGAIINMSSIGLMGNIGQANYAASKAGLIGFTKSVAREVVNRNVRKTLLHQEWSSQIWLKRRKTNHTRCA